MGIFTPKRFIPSVFEAFLNLVMKIIFSAQKQGAHPIDYTEIETSEKQDQMSLNPSLTARKCDFRSQHNQ